MEGRRLLGQFEIEDTDYINSPINPEYPKYKPMSQKEIDDLDPILQDGVLGDPESWYDRDPEWSAHNSPYVDPEMPTQLRDVRRIVENIRYDREENNDIRADYLHDNPSPDTKARYRHKWEKHWASIYTHWPQELREKFFALAVSGDLLNMTPEEAEKYLVDNFSPYYKPADYLDASQLEIPKYARKGKEMGIEIIMPRSPESQAGAAWHIRKYWADRIGEDIEALERRMMSKRKLVVAPDVIIDSHDQVCAELSYRRMAISDLENRLEFYSIHPNERSKIFSEKLAKLKTYNENQINCFLERDEGKEYFKNFKIRNRYEADKLRFDYHAKKDFGEIYEKWKREHPHWLNCFDPLYDQMKFSDEASPEELKNCWNKYRPTVDNNFFTDCQDIHHAIYMNGQV